MYDWSWNSKCVEKRPESCFSCCWKDVRLKPVDYLSSAEDEISFSCCWKDVRLKHNVRRVYRKNHWFQLLLKGCTIEAGWCFAYYRIKRKFQLLLKGCTIEANLFLCLDNDFFVSVVVERMYDWSGDLLDSSWKSTTVSVVVERMYDWSWGVCFIQA